MPLIKFRRGLGGGKLRDGIGDELGVPKSHP